MTKQEAAKRKAAEKEIIFQGAIKAFQAAGYECKEVATDGTKHTLSFGKNGFYINTIIDANSEHLESEIKYAIACYEKVASWDKR